MILFLLLGCFGVTTSGDCVTETFVVDGDDSLGDFDFTTADLTAAVLGVRTFPASLADGRLVTAEMGIARTDEPILFHDTTLTTDRTPRVGFGSNDFDLMVLCSDEVEVPVELDLSTDDGSVDVVAPVVAVARHVGEDPHPGVDDVSLDHVIDPEVDVIPPRGAATEAHLSVRLFGDSVEYVYAEWEDTTVSGVVFSFPPVEAE